MFDKEYTFRGTHAEKVLRLRGQFDEQKNQIFESNYRVYMLAPIVGFLFQVIGERNTDGRETKIFPNELYKIRDDLMFTYRLIMLLDKKHEPSFEERVNKAFRYYGSEKAAADEERFESYVLGGVDKLYEKIMEGAQNPEDYLKNFYNFMEEIDERYSSSTEEIQDLCRLAKE